MASHQLETTGLSAETTVEEIYRSQHERLWWSLLAYTGDRDVASDAVAETSTRSNGHHCRD